jgi:YHS domain-containing protein
MARCNCRYDKKQLDTKTAFKVVIDEKNTYWCSEDCYNHFREAKEKQAKITAEYDEIYELTKQIFGYEFTGYSLLKREINTWEKVSTRAKIIAYLTENKDWLSNVMSKEFAGDFHRVRYYSVIVAGKLHDWKPKKSAKVSESVVTAMSFEFFEPTVEKQPELEEQVLYDVEDDLL